MTWQYSLPNSIRRPGERFPVCCCFASGVWPVPALFAADQLSCTASYHTNNGAGNNLAAALATAGYCWLLLATAGYHLGYKR